MCQTLSCILHILICLILTTNFEINALIIPLYTCGSRTLCDVSLNVVSSIVSDILTNGSWVYLFIGNFDL